MRHQRRWLLTRNERGGPEERAGGTDALKGSVDFDGVDKVLELVGTVTLADLLHCLAC